MYFRILMWKMWKTVEKPLSSLFTRFAPVIFLSVFMLLIYCISTCGLIDNNKKPLSYERSFCVFIYLLEIAFEAFISKLVMGVCVFAI